jgi:steroid delta-isomerase-like uncharacterized protein
MSANLSARAQLALVEEHVSRENAHDLPGIMATFGDRAWYDDEPWGEHHEGRDAVRGYYEDLLTSLPDLRIDIKRSVAAEEGVALEVRISGTQLGSWRGLPPAGLPWYFPSARFFRSTMREGSRASGSTTTVAASCNRWDFITILNP